jgi:hypothetical protein
MCWEEVEEAVEEENVCSAFKFKARRIITASFPARKLFDSRGCGFSPESGGFEAPVTV